MPSHRIVHRGIREDRILSSYDVVFQAETRKGRSDNTSIIRLRMLLFRNINIAYTNVRTYDVTMTRLDNNCIVKIICLLDFRSL